MLQKMAEPLLDVGRRLEPLFPKMEWDLRKAGYGIEAKQYISIVIYLTITTLVITSCILILPFLIRQGLTSAVPSIVFTVIITALAFLYLLFIPKAKIRQRASRIDKDLEYMLKDIQIQLSAGVPLFDTLVNIARGMYGECSEISNGIIKEVEQGKSITDVLDNVGMWSPSEYLRKTLWQIVNAIKSGSDVVDALDAIANDIRMDKENKIKAYGKELNLWGLIYMMVGIIIPSMGVTLLVILSSFLGGTIINQQLFIIILLGIIFFHILFISFVKSKRPNI